MPPREIERLLFSEGALRRFHDQFHGESSLASVSQWKEKQPAGGNQELSERMVIFSMPFNLPAALRTLLPNDKVVIHERQVLPPC